MMRSKKLVICKNWALHEKCWCAGAHTKFWHRAEKCWCAVCALNFGTREKCWCAGARTKFWHCRKNVGVQVRALNLALHMCICIIRCACGVHTHNNGMRGVRSIGRAQRSLVGARAMWVYVVARQFS
jgi:hypothetical protein